MLEREFNDDKKTHLISKVLKGSIAEELEIEVGDKLISINGQFIEDVFDYRYHMNSEAMTILIEKADGEEWEIDIENDYEDIGIEFSSGLMCDYKSCTNKCVFCFIDQMPEGMRETLYFKDDDSRLSFLQGNYITFTNMKDRDIDRIIKFRLAPINISIHTTNPELRIRMLHNRFAGSSLKYLDRLYENNIPMNGQIVMCKGYNDGKELERSLSDLLKLAPVMESVSIVPVGITKYRDRLAKLQSIDKETAIESIELIEKYQRKAKELHGINLFHASDELYLLAGRELPPEESYEGYIQLENGVGMLRLLIEEVRAYLAELDASNSVEAEELSIATGVLPSDTIAMLLAELRQLFPQKTVHLYPIVNEFFGEKITVSGLITGRDLIKQLSKRALGKRLLLSLSMFRSGEEVFLDDLTRFDLEEKLNIRVVKVGSSGRDFVNAIIDENYELDSQYKAYELDAVN